MVIQYFQKWVQIKKAPAVPFSLEEAQMRHQERKPYVAIISDDHKPLYVVDIAADWVSVSFLDDWARIYLDYDFRELRKGELFLNRAIHRQYKDGRDDILLSVMFKFEPDGKIYIERRNYETSIIEEKESFADPAVNWEKFPQFGEYSSLCRANRDAGSVTVELFQLN